MFFRHALRNALRPILTMTAMEAGMAMTMLLYIEVVFGIGGLGPLSLDRVLTETRATTARVSPPSSSSSGSRSSALNLLVDLLYPLLDPRVAQVRAPRRYAPSSPTG